MINVEKTVPTAKQRQETRRLVREALDTMFNIYPRYGAEKKITTENDKPYEGVINALELIVKAWRMTA